MVYVFFSSLDASGYAILPNITPMITMMLAVIAMLPALRYIYIVCLCVWLCMYVSVLLVGWLPVCVFMCACLCVYVCVCVCMHMGVLYSSSVLEWIYMYECVFMYVYLWCIYTCIYISNLPFVLIIVIYNNNKL